MESKAVLLFGQVTPGKFPVVRKLSLGSEAYDRHQLANYISEIIEIRKTPGFVEHRKLFPQIAKIAQAMSANEFFEVGSTLFASVDKFATCVGDQQSRSMKYYGIEPSKLLRETAEILHPNNHLTHYDSSELAHVPNINKSVHRSYQASSYAFHSVSELVNWVSRFGATQDGIWFSTDDQDKTSHFMGTQVTTFSFSQYCKQMKSAGFKLQILTAQKVRDNGLEVRGEGLGATFLEIFCTSYRHDLVDLRHVDWDIHRPLDFDQTGMSLADIPKECWLEARTVPVCTTSLSDALTHGRVLNFAGCHNKVFPN